MDETIRAIILNLLSRHSVMTLATVRPDGFPQATTVYYVNDGLALYFATDPVSQKAANIMLNNKVSVAIAGETENANKLRALPLSGTAAKVTTRHGCTTCKFGCLRRYHKLSDLHRLPLSSSLYIRFHQS